MRSERLTKDPGDGIRKTPLPPRHVRWERRPDGTLFRNWYPGFLIKTKALPAGWAVEGSPEEAAQKAALEAGAAEPAQERMVSVLPAPGPRKPETADERRARLRDPEHGVMQYLEEVRWPAEALGEEPITWDEWRAAQPWAAEADAAAAEAKAAKEKPAQAAPPPPARRPPPPPPPPPARRPPPPPPRR